MPIVQRFDSQIVDMTDLKLILRVAFGKNRRAMKMRLTIVSSKVEVCTALFITILSIPYE